MIRNTHRSIGKPLKGFGAYSIASQCPLAGGITVIKARAMVYMFDDSTTYNDRAICDAVGITLRQAPVKAKQIIHVAKLHPNPANQSVTVVYDIAADCNAEIIFTNSVGQLELKLKIPTDKNQIQFSTIDFAQGVYQYQLKCDKAALDRGKLIIVH